MKNVAATGALLGYGSATLIQGAAGLVAVPLLISVLGPAAFANWAMLEPVVAILAGTVLLGLHYGQLHSIAVGQMSIGAAIREFVRYGVVTAAFLSLLGGGATFFCLLHPGTLTTAFLIAALLVLEGVILLSQFHYRAAGQAVSYAVTVWLRSAGLVAGVASMKMLGWTLDLPEYLFFLIVLDVVVVVRVLLSAWRQVTAGTPIHARSDARAQYFGRVRYGFPMVVASALAVAVGSGDRYVVNGLMDSSQLPAYVVMSKMAGAMAFAMAPVNLWWPTARHRHIGDPDGGASFFQAVFPVLLAYYILAGGMLWLVAQWFAPWFAPGVAGIELAALLVLILGGVALGMNAPANIGTLAPGKTHWTIVTVALSAVCGLVLAVLLVPAFGFMGAAIATLAAQCANLFATYWVSQKLHPLELMSGKLWTIAALGSSSLGTLWFLRGNGGFQVVAIAIAGCACGWLLRKELRVILIESSRRDA